MKRLMCKHRCRWWQWSYSQNPRLPGPRWPWKGLTHGCLQHTDCSPQWQTRAQHHPPGLGVGMGGCHFEKLLPAICSLVQQSEKLWV